MFHVAAKAAVASLLIFGAMQPTSHAADLSRCREFQLGSSLATIAKQTGLDPAQAKVVQSRPALIQQLDWRPQSVNAPARSEAVLNIEFLFLNGELYQIAASYDRYEIEGLTAGDLIESISTTFGAPGQPSASAKLEPGRYADEEEVLSQWQDSQYSFELIRSSFGRSYRLQGVLKRLQAAVQAATLEASRLDDKEAPQRELDRAAKADETERVKLEKARTANKPKFRP